jgi:hypothetical protein
MMKLGHLAIIAVAVCCAEAMAAPTQAHIDAVTRAQRSAYIISSATNGCPILNKDTFGWPGAKLKECEYAVADPTLDHARVGYAILLDVSAERIAAWVENACAKIPTTDQEICFTKVLGAGNENSGFQFAVAGNVLENMGGAGYKNYYFRNGMTASFVTGVNASAKEVSMGDQKIAAAKEDSAVISIPSGLTRFWRTIPYSFRARFPELVGLLDLKKAADRATWLALARTEMLRALDNDDNRLLEAWLCANSAELLGKPCPPRPAP